MAGLYIHIPFCKQPCSYCNFFFSTSENLAAQTVHSMIREIEFYALDWQIEFDSLYFGGGTPSHLPLPLLQDLVEAIKQNFNFKVNAEFTLEANPDDLNPRLLGNLRGLGINRLSLGVQSFNDDALALMNRAHSAKMATDSITWAKQVGFDNISMDLIYGIPGQGMEIWKRQLDQFLKLELNHLSAYALTVEPGTKLFHDIRKGKMKDVSDEGTAKQFGVMSETLRKSGYLHYEVSNLALPGKEAVHNASYWSGKPYLGIGPSAHSFNKNSRWWNVASLMPYIRQMETGIPQPEKESIDLTTRYNEMVMTGLRTQNGIKPKVIKSLFGNQIYQHFSEEVSKQHLLFQENDGRILLRPQDFLFADGIASDLMIA